MDSPEERPKVYLELRVFTHLESRDGPYQPSTNHELLSRQAVEFANVLNASSVYERCERALSRAVNDGLAKAPDRVKPGPKEKKRHA